METRQEVTKKLIIGAVIIIVSLIIGKLVLIPLFIFPGDEKWALAMFWVYVLSWVILLIGVLIAGMEGYKLAMHRYRDIKTRSIDSVKRGGRKVGQKSVQAVKTVGQTSANAARTVGQKSRTAARKVKEKGIKAKERIKRTVT
ncbi:TPA: hypothetical protein HA265_07835 [Candidatus Woesearchaeota archaeon]|nr:hypothetical protein [Candidatus Woesearchaeota archaeon]